MKDGGKHYFQLTRACNICIITSTCEVKYTEMDVCASEA